MKVYKAFKILWWLLFFLPWTAAALDLNFIQNEGMEYRILSEVQEGIWRDKELLGSSEILNRITVNIAEADTEGSFLEAGYSISEKSLDTGLYIYTKEEKSRFYRSRKGEYSRIPPENYLPSVRHIPTFPEKEVEPGDSWVRPGEEVHDLAPFFGVDHREHIRFNVFYTYLGPRDYENRRVEAVKIVYHFLKKLDLSALTPGRLPPPGHDLPQKAGGDFEQIYLWDPDAGIPAAVQDEFKITYTMESGVSYIFKGRSEGRVTEADQWNRDEVEEEIRQALEELEDVSVTTSPDGVVLVLDNIHFVPDSSRFLPGEEEKLKKLEKILMDYPDHDLMITGHTARVRGGSPDQGQSLSESRAAAVAGYFLKRNIRNSSRMIVQGKGSSEPVGDNSTEEGRRKNRRVEITILDN